MTFLAPSRLWLLAVVPLLVAAYVLLQRRRKRYVVQFTNLHLLGQVAPRRPGWRRHLAASLLLASLMVLIGAFARPAISMQVPRERSAVMLVIDVSRSMAATDVAPDRISAAKRASMEFIATVPEELPIGAVAFSDTAIPISPVGSEREQTRLAIQNLTPVGGTAIGDGLATALSEIERHRAEGDAPAAVLLLSDGASNRGIPSGEAAQRAASMEVPVFTVGLGTDGATIDIGGRSVPVDLDEEELRGIAEATGGAYFRTADAEALRAVYRDLGSQLGYEEETREVTAPAAALAGLVLLIGAAASLIWFQRIP